MKMMMNQPRDHIQLLTTTLVCLIVLWIKPTGSLWAAPPAPPGDFAVKDYPLDDGSSVKVSFTLSPDDVDESLDDAVTKYVIEASSEANGFFHEAGSYTPVEEDFTDDDRRVGLKVGGIQEGVPTYFRIFAENAQGERSPTIVYEQAVTTSMAWFDFTQFRLLILVILICSAVIYFIELARRGYPLKVRKIAGLEAIDEAVGRATEMGKKCLYVPGIQDINDIQTIAGLNILSRVARTVGEFDAEIEVPTARSLVMTAASETIEGAFLAAGRPDAFDPKSIYYVTD